MSLSDNLKICFWGLVAPTAFLAAGFALGFPWGESFSQPECPPPTEVTRSTETTTDPIERHNPMHHPPEDLHEEFLEDVPLDQIEAWVEEQKP